MSWLFSQALVEEFSAGTSLDGAPCAQLNVTPTQHKFWRNDKTIDASDLSQFGLTSQLLTDAHGAELLTSFLAVFPVRTSAKVGLEEDSPANEAASGRIWQGSFVRYDPDTSSWKTPQCSLLEDSTECLGTWPRWGSMRNGACFLRPAWAPTTCANASGLLPTPTRSWARRGPGISYNLDNLRMSLGATQATHAIVAAVGWRWPASFVEWMMGWPIQWTGLQPLETAKFREWQQQHGGF